MTILDKIVNHKKKEVAERKLAVPTKKLEEGKFFDRTTFSAKEFMLMKERAGLIAEFKRKSPSKGVINDRVMVEDVTTGYNRAGASCLSVLTDTAFFGGTNYDLVNARKVNNIPILRKDFIIDEYQILEAKALGADFILLIAACMPAKKLSLFAQLAKSLGMEVLLELHGRDELKHINPFIDMVGVNNRDLHSFEVDVQRSLDMYDLLPKDMIKISESGLHKVENVIKLKEKGYQGFLVGEAFMKTENPPRSCKEYIEKAGLIKKNV